MTYVDREPFQRSEETSQQYKNRLQCIGVLQWTYTIITNLMVVG